MPIVIPISARMSTVLAIATDEALLGGAKVMLFKNDYQPSATTVLADLIEADFTGYARSADLVWGEPFITPAQLAEIVAQQLQFNATGSTVTNTIYGYAVITPGTPDVLQYAERFAEPVFVAGTMNAVLVNPRYRFPPG